jgi:SAM-dependent methyltransferase
MKGHIREAGVTHRAHEARGENPIWFVVPCMGRRRFLEQTAARVLAHPQARYCLVDYACPDRCGDWFERTFASHVRAGRAVVERVRGETRFNKSRAHNAGARRASRDGAEFLCFLDADTLVERGFYDWIAANARPDRFLIAGPGPNGRDVPSMAGLLVVSAEAFRKIDGFDEAFVGWGGEDIELRLRLHLLGGLDFADVPSSLTRSIPHGDHLRTQFYDVPSTRTSNAQNMAYVRRKVASWSGRCVREIRGAERLWAVTRLFWPTPAPVAARSNGARARPRAARPPQLPAPVQARARHRPAAPRARDAICRYVDTFVDGLQHDASKAAYVADLLFHRDRIVLSIEWIADLIRRGGVRDLLVVGDDTVIDWGLKALGHYDGVNVVFSRCELREAFPIPSASFDLVVSLEVLEHLKDRDGTRCDVFNYSGAENLVAECYRVLRPGGALFLTTPNACCTGAIGRLLSQQHPHMYSGHVREYTPSEVRRLLSEGSFEIEILQTIDVWSQSDRSESVGFRRAHRAAAALLAKSAASKAERGDDIFVIAKKRGLDR